MLLFLVLENLSSNKAYLLQKGIFSLIHLFVRDVLVMKKLEMEKTKPTVITGKSFSEALILASVNQQYDKRLFI